MRPSGSVTHNSMARSEALPALRTIDSTPAAGARPRKVKRVGGRLASVSREIQEVGRLQGAVNHKTGIALGADRVGGVVVDPMSVERYRRVAKEDDGIDRYFANVVSDWRGFRGPRPFVRSTC